MNSAGSLAVTLFGRLAACRAGVEVDLGGRRQRAVLGVLVTAHGEAVPVSRLIELVWPLSPPADAVAALQAQVSHLRRGLQPGRSRAPLSP